MKIYIITIHCIPNFGSILQTYALAKFIKNSGREVEVIDYRPPYYFKGRSILRKIFPIIFYPIPYLSQAKKVRNFCKKYIPLTQRAYRSFDELKTIEAVNNIFVSGGDQLWNSFHPCGRDDAYKLTFVKSPRKIAYGTSMGRTSFEEKELKDIAAKVIDYHSIGLREQSTVSMLQHYTKVPVTHVADPVLLLNKEDYLSFIGPTPMIKEPYMLVYMAAKSVLLDAVVDKISKDKGLKIVHVSGFSKKCKCDYKLTTGPEELLNLIYYADFVLSASFHATLFSILFNKQFCTLLPEAGTNIRIENVLSYLHLENRIIHSCDDLSQLDTIIDYDEVNKIKEHFALDSRSYLLETLNQVEKI